MWSWDAIITVRATASYINGGLQGMVVVAVVFLLSVLVQKYCVLFSLDLGRVTEGRLIYHHLKASDSDVGNQVQ